MKTNSSISPEVMADYRRTFQKRSKARFQAREKRRQQAKQAAFDAIDKVIPHYPLVQRVYLFGSVITSGVFSENSDVDVGIEGVDMALCFDIWRDLERAAPEWTFDVRSLDPDDPFSERVRQKGELVYEWSNTTS